MGLLGQAGSSGSPEETSGVNGGLQGRYLPGAQKNLVGGRAVAGGVCGRG